MNAGRVGDFADDPVVVQVNDDHLRRVRNVKPLRRGIHRQRVPAAVTTDGYFLDKMVRLVCAANRDSEGKQNGQQDFFHGCDFG